MKEVYIKSVVLLLLCSAAIFMLYVNAVILPYEPGVTKSYTPGLTIVAILLAGVWTQLILIEWNAKIREEWDEHT